MKYIVGLNEVNKDMENSRGLKNLSSECNLGTSYRMFVRLYESGEGKKDLFIVGTRGRNVAYRRMGAKADSFVELSEFIEEDKGLKLDKSGLVPWARICKAYHEAECEYEKANIEKAKKQIALEQGRSLDDPKVIGEIAIAVNNIDIKYHGQEKTDETPAVSPDVPPLISGLKTFKFTEAYLVPLDNNKNPDWKNAKMVCVPLTSAKKVNQLNAIMADSTKVDANDEFLEIAFDYGINAKDKKEAGNSVVWVGVPKDQKLAAVDPEGFAKFKSQLESMTKDPEVMVNRNQTLKFAKSVEEVIESIKKYISLKPLALRKLDFESTSVKSCAKDMVELGIAKMDTFAQEKLIKILEEATEEDNAEVAKENAAEEQVPEAVEKMAEATSLSEMQSIMSESSEGDLSALADIIED